MFKRTEEITVTIDAYAFGGKGIAKLATDDGEFVVFVENTFPGQTVKAKVTKVKKRYAEASLVDVVKRSPREVESGFQEISGAPYIYVPIADQEEAKTRSTLEVFRRLGGIQEPANVFDAFIASPMHYFYRNKMEYSFSSIEHDPVTNQEFDDAFALGFKRRGTWWKVESLNKPSGLFDEQWEQFIPQLRTWCKQTGLPAWHPPGKHGFFRHIVVRKSFKEDQLLINLVTSSNGIQEFDKIGFTQQILESFEGRIAGIQHTINDNVADRAKIENGSTELLYGRTVVVEELLGLNFEISMESFFQTNPKCAELLYQKAIDYVVEVKHDPKDVVMDLFCGTGTIGQLLAKQLEGVRIVGVDIVEEAIMDAKRNAQRNNVNTIEFYTADVGKFLTAYPDFKGKIKTIVLDPPRAGIAPKTLQKVIALDATHLVYISCNPATQARDMDTLKTAGYRVDKITLVDQFPHTGHIESIVKFSRG